MPNYQGQLDGLCGPYAIANAFEHCGVEDGESIFEISCSSLAQRRWPDVLWSGTTFNDLQRMIKRCRENIDGAASVKVSYPFRRTTPHSSEDYWGRFDQLFREKPNAKCMILGITRPSSHWIVAHRGSGTRVTFVDTDPYRPSRQKNRTMLFAGSRNGDQRKWLIDRSELILFETESAQR